MHTILFSLCLMSFFRLASSLRSTGNFPRNQSVLGSARKSHGIQRLQLDGIPARSIHHRNQFTPSSLDSFYSVNFQRSRLYSTPPTDDSPIEIYADDSSNESIVNDNEEVFHTTTSIILDGLNPSQVQAVTQPNSDVTRVIAGPGSGKTKVLTCRIAYLLEQDRNSRILAVTFTRKAAGEMQERVESLLRQRQSIQDNLSGSTSAVGAYDDSNGLVEEATDSLPRGLERVTLGTFHSLCSKILRFNGNQLATLPSVLQDMAGVPGAVVNLDGSFAILDQSDQLRIVRGCLDEAEIDLKKSGIKPLAILSEISQIKEQLSQGIDAFATKDRRKPLPKAMKFAQQIYGSYREKVFTNNALDFDDLIFMTRELLIEDRELRERLHKRWRHVLIDEFQDTSRSQMDLVKLLTSSSLFVVGDADQSIYSWRGAHVGSLNDFAQEFQQYAPGGGVSTVFLKENYRSTSNIVRAAEKVISSSNEKDDLRRSMKPQRGSGPSPRIVACLDERAEANFVVDTIQDMLNDGKIGHDQTVAVLYRTNAQSRYLEEACVQQNLPYVIRGGAGGFYKRAEVKDCLCFLRWLHNGNDEGAMLRAIKTPSRGIGDKALVEFREYCTEVNSYHQEHFPEIKRLTPLDILISMTDDESGSSYILAEGAPEASVFISKRALNNFLPFSRQMREIRHRAHSIPVEKLLFMIIEELDLVNHFDSISKSKSEFEERRENVQELRKATKRYSHYGAALKVQDNEDNDEFGSESALGMFLDDVALVTDIAGVSEQGDNRLVVSLMTIHASKGTEFDVVFVVGNEEGTLPGNRALQEGEGSVELEEEKRLCYVAMTRAKTQLVMTWRKQVTSFSNWSDDGSRMKQTDRSRFLDALISKKSRSKGLATKQPKKTTDRDVGQILRQQRRGAKSATEFQKRRPPQPSRSQPSKSYSSAASPRKTNGSLDAKRVNIDMSNPKRPEINANGYNTDMPIRPKKSPPVNGGAGPRMIRPRETEDYSPRTKPSATGFNGNAPERVSRDNGRSKPTKPFISGDKNLASRTKPTNERPEFDSTWFFPVGSTVVHGNFGKGVVLQPPPAGKSKNLLVRVQFENGRTMEFPAKGTDIVPDFLT